MYKTMISPSHFNFTIQLIKELPTKEKRYICHDAHPKSNGLKIEVMTSGKKFFRLKQKFKGKTRSFSLGEFGLITIEEARNKAREKQALLHQGIDPNIEKKAALAKQATLREIFPKYLASKRLADKTIKGYFVSMHNVLSPIADTSMLDISFEKILKIHQEYSIKSKAESNRAMRLLRALFNHAIDELRDTKNRPVITENPVKKLFKNGHIQKLDRKVSHLKDDQLPIFVDYLESIAKDDKEYPSYRTGADLLLLMLFHGTRMGETQHITKDMVNLQDKSFWLTKTKAQRTLRLPMTSFSEGIFERRFLLAGDSIYLFPSVKDKTKPISDTKKPLKALHQETGILTTPHDLRRTFMTIGNRLDISVYTLKQLANHSLNNNDVTAGYVIQTPEELRPASQKITNYILGIKSNNNQNQEVIKSMFNALTKEEQLVFIDQLPSSH
jgi:integrase